MVMVMVMNDLLPPPLFYVIIGPPILRYSYFKIWSWKFLVNTMRMVKDLGNIWPWKFKDQGHCQGQTWWSQLRPKVKSICLLFVSWQSDQFRMRYSKLLIWPWKIQGQCHGQGQTWWSHLRPWVETTILGWDIANYIFDLEKSRSRSWRKSTKI